MEGPWTIFGAIAAAVAAAAGFFSISLQPRSRRNALKEPCIAWFEIARSSQRLVSYAEQDDREHSVFELTLPANSIVEIEILYRSKISFLASEIYLGCGDQDYRDLDKKPLVNSICYPLIEVGTTKETPQSNSETNAIDRHKFYHLRRQKNITVEETYSLGCELNTRDPGQYKFQVFFVGEEIGRLRNKLYATCHIRPKL
jgi:hypothetical protein